MKTTAALKTHYLTLCIMTALSSTSLSTYAQQNETQAQENNEMETIEVRGIRRSLTEALNTKAADSVVDSISAEDIGNF